jgi:phosphatidylserine/phosphatidylglycerophosphate/cardiolipin synthase-like enzyme
VRIQPLLTPDKNGNGDSLFIQHILELIENAQEKIYFQNQSLKPDWNNAEYTRLYQALARKSRDQNLDVRIIVSEYADLSVLTSSNFNVDRVRKQRECHNKGIIVDNQKVVVGSHNWTGQGATRNRDASLIFDDAEIAAYFTEIFLFDWDNLATSEDAFMSLMPLVAREGEQTPEGMVRVAWHDFFPESRSALEM